MAFEQKPVNLVLSHNDALDDYTEYADKPQDECGVVGIIGETPYIVTLGFHALRKLQHRGRDTAGLYINSDFQSFYGTAGVGKIPEALKDMAPQLNAANGEVISPHDGYGATILVAHTRYGTTHSHANNPGIHGVQPVLGREKTTVFGQNGAGSPEAMQRLAKEYELPEYEDMTDSYILGLVIDKRALELDDYESALLEVLPKVDAAYCLVASDGQKLFAIRDPWGVHPLCIGELPDKQGLVAASEQSAFWPIGAEFIRHVEPGEIVVMDKDGTIRSAWIDRPVPKYQKCMYELAYTMKPYNEFDGIGVYDARKQMGRFLAEDYPYKADAVVGIRESGTSAAAGYAEYSGIPKKEGFHLDDFDRSFIAPPTMRDHVVGSKQVPNPTEVRGKRLIIVDDSIIKGETMKKNVALLFQAGALELHLLAATPEFMFSCERGMYTPQRDLIAARMTRQEMAAYFTPEGIDPGRVTVDFLSVERFEQAARIAAKNSAAAKRAGEFCTACFTGEDPYESSVSFTTKVNYAASLAMLN